MIKGNLFITGGAGYLGQGIIKRATEEKWPCSITVFSRDEVKHANLKRLYPDVRTIRGDVGGDLDHLITAMTGHDVVIHAAATKIVPMAEFNVVQTVRDNVIGSLNVAHAAAMAGVKQCIAISTDKAAAPINTYGLCKSLMERIFQEAQEWSYPTDYYLTRYGNVLDSTASVLGVWAKQYVDTGSIKVTNPDMTRFWLTVDQAVDLILLALKNEPGTVTIPMLPAMSMGDMAKALYPQAEIEVIGERPGEKVHEDLLTEQECHRAIANYEERVFTLYPSGYIVVDEDKPESYSSNNAFFDISEAQLLEMVQ